MKRLISIVSLLTIVVACFAQQAIVPSGLNMSGSVGSASVSIGQIHYITLPQVQAGVQQWYNLLYQITTSGTNGTITGGGEYAANASATLSASPAECYAFARWSDGNTSNPRTVTVTGDATYTAIFEKVQYTVTTAPDNAEHGSTEAAKL